MTGQGTSFVLSLPMDARVTTKLKARIWANEFINFGQLITVTPMKDKFNISANTSKDSPGQPTLCLEPLQKDKNISTIDTWTFAFQRYLLEYILLNFWQKLQPL